MGVLTRLGCCLRGLEVTLHRLSDKPTQRPVAVRRYGSESLIVCVLERDGNSVLTPRRHPEPVMSDSSAVTIPMHGAVSSITCAAALSDVARRKTEVTVLPRTCQCVGIVTSFMRLSAETIIVLSPSPLKLSGKKNG